MSKENKKVTSIKIGYEDGSSKEIDKGFAMFIDGADAQAEFKDIDSKRDIIALLKGIQYSLDMAHEQFEKAEAEEQKTNKEE